MMMTKTATGVALEINLGGILENGMAVITALKMHG